VSDALAELQRFVLERFPRAGELRPETRLVADLALDSIQQIDLLVELENHFAVALDVDDDGIETLGDLAACIERARAGGAVGG
jgi:acyl carrier protein